MTRVSMRAYLFQSLGLAALAACGASPPAAAGADRGAQPASAEQPFTTAAIGSFDAPWAMDFLPGSGRPLTSMALVSEKGGRLWLVDVASGKRQPVGGVPAAEVAGQGGLGDVVAHPDFAGNQRVYLSFVEAGPNRTSGAAVGFGRLVLGSGAPRIEGFKVIWRQSPKVGGDGHFSHRIAFAPDGSLFVSSGDRQESDPAQDRASDLGKIIRMTAEGQRVGGRFATMGHRNVLGLAFAPDGRLWATEMGPRGGDELNLIVAGRNYGWPQASYGSGYGGGAIPDEHQGRGFEEPKRWWTPSISPAGLTIYSGDLFPQWKGDALFGALSGESFLRADIEGETVKSVDRWEMGARIRDVAQGPDGSVYVLEDGSGGRLLRLDPVRR